MLCGLALSACRKTRSRPPRSTTATLTLLPIFSHSVSAASAIASPMRTPTSRCVITCACDDDRHAHAVNRPATKANRTDMNEPPSNLQPSATGALSLAPGFGRVRIQDYVMPAIFDDAEMAPTLPTHFADHWRRFFWRPVEFPLARPSLSRRSMMPGHNV